MNGEQILQHARGQRGARFERRVFAALTSIERGIGDLALLCTLLTLAFWFFAPATALIGPRSWWWIPIGVVIVCGAIPLAFAIFEMRRELEVQPGPRVVFKFLYASRGLFALLGALALFQRIAVSRDASWSTVVLQLRAVLLGSP